MSPQSNVNSYDSLARRRKDVTEVKYTVNLDIEEVVSKIRMLIEYQRCYYYLLLLLCHFQVLYRTIALLRKNLSGPSVRISSVNQRILAITDQ